MQREELAVVIQLILFYIYVLTNFNNFLQTLTSFNGNLSYLCSVKREKNKSL
jgi:hypothetical protein